MLFNRLFRGVLRDPNDGQNQGGAGGAGSQGGGDAPLTLEAIRGLLDERLNGYDKRLQKQLKALGGGQQQQQQANSDDDDPPPQQSAKHPGVDPEVVKLRKELDKQRKELADANADRAREKDEVRQEKKDAALRRELAKFSFVDDEAFETAYARLDRETRYSDEGALIGGTDDLPLGKFVADRIKKLDFLLKPKEVGGAGVANGGKAGVGTVDTDLIKPGMKPEDAQAVLAAALKSLGN